MPPASSRSLSQLPLTLPVSALHLISMPHLHDSSEYLWGRMWSLPSGPSPPLGAPVSWGFHQGLGDDPSCLLCLASMEATKPQESKRTILRSKNGYGCEVVATLLTVLFLLLVLTLYELKVYTCTCEQQSMARALVFRNLPIPPERWRLHQELVAPMSAQGGRIFSVPERHIILNHSVLELSFLRRAASHSMGHWFWGAFLRLLSKAGGLKRFGFTLFPEQWLFLSHTLSSLPPSGEKLKGIPSGKSGMA